MDEHGYLCKSSNFLINTEICFVFLVWAAGNRVQSLLGPEVIPVHCAAVDNRGELTAPFTELFSNRWEGKYDMESLPALWNKEGELLISAVSLVGFTSSLFDFLTDCSLFILREQIGNLTWVEQIVDVFKEALTHNLCVWEKELNLFFVETASN